MEGFLIGYLALAVSVWAGLPSERKLDIRLRLTVFDISFVSVLFVLTLYVIYLDPLRAAGLALPIPWVPGFDPNKTVFTYMLVVVLFSAYKLSSNRLPRSRVAALAKECNQLIYLGRLSEASFLLEKHHESIVKYSKYSKFEQWLAELVAIFGNADPFGHLIHGNGYYSTSAKNRVNESQEIMANVVKSPRMIQAMATSHPLVCAKFSAAVKGLERDDFDKALFRYLLRDTSSLLYREMIDNKNLASGIGYSINPNNKLINFYLGQLDATSGHYAILHPMYCYVKDFTNGVVGDVPVSDIYNRPYYGSSNPEELDARCPIHVTISMFDIMVTRAIRDRRNGHIWLMNLTKIVELIARDVDSVNWRDEEFPTRYHHLMYFAFSSAIGWVGDSVELITDYGRDTKESTLSVETSRDNCHPEYWAAKTVGDIFRTLFSAAGSNYHPIYYLEMLVKLIHRLEGCGRRDFADLVLFTALSNDGFRIDYDHAERVRLTYFKIDHVLRGDGSVLDEVFTRHDVVNEAPITSAIRYAWG